MSFLFGKKKTPQGTPPSTSRDINTAGGPNGTAPSINGVKEKDRAPGAAQASTPGSSVNNSLNSLGGGATPSPEHGSGARGIPEQDNQYGPRPSLNGPSPSGGIPNAALYPWSQRRLTFTSSQPNPFPRYGAAVNATSSKEGDIYLMGGLVNGSTVKGDLWMIEAGGGNLACYPIGTTSEGPGPRVGHASLLVGNAFIVFGGDTKIDERDQLDDTLYLLNTSTRQWSRAVPPGSRPAGRYGHTLNILGSKIYIFGGQVEGCFFNDLIAFDLNALQSPNSRWELLIQNSADGGPPDGQIPPARTNHTIVSWNDKLYLFGGTNGSQWFNDVWSYDPRSNTWSQLDCIGYIPAPREGHSAALVNDVMYIFGGRTEEGTDLGDLAAFRITSRRWYTFQNMGPSPSPRSGHSMTAYGKQIVVLAGEPSSAPRDPGELSLVYVLDTSKIRYPNDQQIQQTPTGERVPGNRRPSGERSAIPQSRGIIPREHSNGPLEGPKRMLSGSRESMIGAPAPMGRGPDSTAVNGPSGPGPGSRLPRVATAQAPSGPPPSQQAPTPRTNGIQPTAIGPRSKTPTKDGRNFGPPVDTARAASFDKENISPSSRDDPRGPSNRAISPITNGRRTPTQIQPSKLTNLATEAPGSPMNEGMDRSRSRQARQQASLDSIDEPSPHFAAQQSAGPPQYDGADDFPVTSGIADKGSHPVPTEPHAQQLERFTQQHDALTEELDAVRSRNAWYASELALARKAGYQPTTSRSHMLDEKAAQSFGDDDKPLIEALIAMRVELADVQSSVESRVQESAQRVAEVEQQRDTALKEAVYAKAKLAAHGGSQRGTPQLDEASKDMGDFERSDDMGRRLASALAAQGELRVKAETLATELQNERRARELAEGTADAANRRAGDLASLHNPGEVETLKAELHHAEKKARDEAALRAEAYAKAQLLEVDKEDLTRQLEDALNISRDHTTTLGTLREAVTASHDKSTLLERRLDEERGHREGLEQKLLHLRAEHEERTAELELMTRKLRDAEELAEKHANEAQKHRHVLISGLDSLNNRSINDRNKSANDERVAILQRQVESANELVRKNRADADAAADKLRGAEERIAGLEAYQEQGSRENLNVRKQLHDSVQLAQKLHAQYNEVRQQLESHQRDASALSVQHSALKDLLAERGINGNDHQGSRSLNSPGGRFNTPDQSRQRDLEQQLEASLRAHQETKFEFEVREQEADKTYREKLEQLEQDYQSAVHYVKGTEKMLKRMKDELTKYKSQNARLQTELEELQRTQRDRSVESEVPADWENERQSLRREIEEMQESVKGSVSQLERQMQQVRTELHTVQEERDHFRASNEQAQHHLTQTAEQTRADLEQLKHENTLLENRAVDAEQKVSFLLDQVGTSVDNYRRQSQQLPSNSNGHARNLSTNSNLNFGGHSHSNSIGAESAFSVTAADNRNSVALDSLASELETLRTQWEGTHRTYRLSSQFDFERTPTSATGGELSDSLANWRKRLDAEEREKDNSRSPIGSPVDGRRVASPRGRQEQDERMNLI